MKRYTLIATHKEKTSGLILDAGAASLCPVGLWPRKLIGAWRVVFKVQSASPSGPEMGG